MIANGRGRIYVEDCRPHHWHKRTAYACIRLDRLQEGYRRIKLNTDSGLPSDGYLLVKIEKKLMDERPRHLSLRKTWKTCKREVSKWSCIR